MRQLAAKNTAQVLDLLSARLAFEKTGVKLYDAVIGKIERSESRAYQAMVGTLRKHRDEEKEHEEWLESLIRELGGHPGQQTDLARLEIEESRGIQSVILDGHTKPVHLIHALLAAELADNAGWEVLVNLAGETGDRRAKAELSRRMMEEAKHLRFIREAMLRAAKNEILGQHHEMPANVAPVPRRPFALVGGIVGGFAAATLAMVTARSLRRI